MKYGRRLLSYALVLSLVIHAIVAAVFRPLPTIDAKSKEPPIIQVQRTHRISSPTPTPQPTPKHTNAEKPQPHNAPPVAPPVTGTNNGPGPVIPPGPHGTSGPGPVGPVGPSASPGTPEVTPTPKPACSVPNAPAETVNVVTPSVPQGVEGVGAAQAQVRVTLLPSGAVENVEIYHSAGNPLLNREALRAARQSTYRAEVKDCVSVRGDYLFTVDFTE